MSTVRPPAASTTPRMIPRMLTKPSWPPKDHIAQLIAAHVVPVPAAPGPPWAPRRRCRTRRGTLTSPGHGRLEVPNIGTEVFRYAGPSAGVGSYGDPMNGHATTSEPPEPSQRV